MGLISCIRPVKLKLEYSSRFMDCVYSSRPGYCYLEPTPLSFDPSQSDLAECGFGHLLHYLQYSICLGAYLCSDATLDICLKATSVILVVPNLLSIICICSHHGHVVCNQC